MLYITFTRRTDNRNILRCKSEAILKLRQRIETLKNKITEHDNSPFTKTTGKLQTGLTCHHRFNTDTLGEGGREGSSIDNEYDPLLYGVQEVEGIGHFTVVSLVTWPLSGSEAGVDLVLIKTLPLFT